MNATQATPEIVVDPICGKTVDPNKIQITSTDDKGIHFFCSESCRRQYDEADIKAKKGIWAKYTERLKNTHCTRTPPECH